MEFFSFIALVLIAVILWRINSQIPDLIFRLAEIQRDIPVITVFAMEVNTINN